MTKYPQFSNCSDNQEDLVKINLVFSINGAVCSLISALILVLLVIYKEYRSVLQRLFLYLMVAIFLREFFIAASIEHHWKYEKQSEICEVIGFIWSWTGILVFVFTVGMKIYLCVYVYYIANGRDLQSMHCKVVLEILYVCLSTVVTLLYAGVPFITSNYGLAGAWCWIRALNESCKVNQAGLYNQIFNGYVSGSIIGLILVIAVAVFYWRLPVTHNRNKNKLLLKKTFCVIITFLVNIIIMVFALFTRVTAAKRHMYKHPSVWFSFAVTFPISLLLFPIVYLILFSVGNRMMCCIKKRHQNIRVHSIQAATVQESSRISAPSETWFSVPHPNSSESEALISGHSTDRGYGSDLSPTAL